MKREKAHLDQNQSRFVFQHFQLQRQKKEIKLFFLFLYSCAWHTLHLSNFGFGPKLCAEPILPLLKPLFLVSSRNHATNLVSRIFISIVSQARLFTKPFWLHIDIPESSGNWIGNILQSGLLNNLITKPCSWTLKLQDPVVTLSWRAQWQLLCMMLSWELPVHSAEAQQHMHRENGIVELEASRVEVQHLFFGDLFWIPPTLQERPWLFLSLLFNSSVMALTCSTPSHCSVAPSALSQKKLLASLSRGSGCTLSLRSTHVKRRMQRLLDTAWHCLTLLDTAWQCLTMLNTDIERRWSEMNRDELRWTRLTPTRLREGEVAICSQLALWLSEVRPWSTVARHAIGTAAFLVCFSARLKEKEIVDKWKTCISFFALSKAWVLGWLFAQLFTHLGPSKASERHCMGAARVESRSSAAWPGWQPGLPSSIGPILQLLFWPLAAFWFGLPFLRHSLYLSPLPLPILRLTSDESLKSGADASNNSWVKQWISSSNRLCRCKVSPLRRYNFGGHKLSTVKSSAAARQALPLDFRVSFFYMRRKTKMPPLLKKCRLYGKGTIVALPRLKLIKLDKMTHMRMYTCVCV